jgi:hypothetical protein
VIPPPDPVIDEMARESARNAPRLTEEQKHTLAILLRPFVPIEDHNPQAA